MNPNIFIKLSDDDFRLKAFAEYAARAQERYSALIEAVSGVPDLVTDERLEAEPLSPDTINSIIQNYMTEKGIQDSPIALSRGYTTTSALMNMIYTKTYQDLKDGSGDDYDNISKGLFQLVDAAGSPIVEYDAYSLAEIGSEMQSQLHSVTCLYAAAESFQQKLESSVADAITRYNDILAGYFTNVHADISSTSNYMKNLLVSSSDPNEFIRLVISKSGIEQESNAKEGDGTVMRNSDIYAYTGASPSGPLDFSSVASAGATVAKTAAKVVVGIYKGVASIAKSLFTRIKKKIVETVIDPADLQVINSSGFGTVDGFQFQSNNVALIAKPGDLPDADLTAFANYFSNKLGTWFAYKTRFSEILIRFDQFRDITVDSMNVDYTWVSKPRIINYKVAETCLPAGNNGSIRKTNSFEETEQFLANLSACGDRLYDISALSEVDAFRGLLYGMYLEDKITGAGWTALYESHPTWVDGFSVHPFADVVFGRRNQTAPGSGDNIGQVTNLDWLCTFSGWNPTNRAFESQIQFWYKDPTTVMGMNLGPESFSFAKAALVSRLFEFTRPYDEAPFVPYSAGHTDFNPPSYRIATDNENKKAFNTFLVTAVIVTVAAIVLTGSVALLKKAQKARYFKYASRQAKLDSKMWDPKAAPLTATEKRQYIRAKKRTERSGLFSSSFQNPASALAPQSGQDASAPIISLIKG